MKKNSAEFSEFLGSLAISGKSGTLKYLGKGSILEGKLLAKSGSIQRVRSYAGYYRSNSGKLYAFAIIVNNYNCTGTEMKKRLEKLLISEFQKM